MGVSPLCAKFAGHALKIGADACPAKRANNGGDPYFSHALLDGDLHHPYYLNDQKNVLPEYG